MISENIDEIIVISAIGLIISFKSSCLIIKLCVSKVKKLSPANIRKKMATFLNIGNVIMYCDYFWNKKKNYVLLAKAKIEK
jgi:hypothetical protein